MTERAKATYRIRRTEGSETEWMIVRLDFDGREAEPYKEHDPIFTSENGIDDLLRQAWPRLLPSEGAVIEFVYPGPHK